MKNRRIPRHLIRKKKKNSKAFFILGLLIILILFIGYKGYTAQRNSSLSAQENLSSAENHVLVEIPPDSGIFDIGKILAREKVISNAFCFSLVAKFSGLGGQLKPGKYNLKKDMSYLEVVKILSQDHLVPKKKYYKLTIPEGFTVGQVADRLGKNTPIDAEEFKNLVLSGDGFKVADYNFLKNIPIGSLEGYLFPKTYEFSEDKTAKDVLKMMLFRFSEEFGKFDLNRVQEKGFTVHEIITIASLIEKEVRVPEERELVSAVIYNRLQKRMPLEFCSTVQYILPERKASLSTEDLKIDSPYNTYIYRGLPPGPICNPGSASINAALNPASVDYLYFVLADSDGHHVFTSSYDEFLRVKKEAKKGW